MNNPQQPLKSHFHIVTLKNANTFTAGWNLQLSYDWQIPSPLWSKEALDEEKNFSFTRVEIHEQTSQTSSTVISLSVLLN